MQKKWKIKHVVFIFCALSLLLYFGVFTHLFEIDFETNFHYPFDGDIEELIGQLRRNVTPQAVPINIYNFRFNKTCRDKCNMVESLRLVFLIKSAPENFQRRIAIRSTWGFERRFSDVEVRRVFLIGERNNPNIQTKLDQESLHFADLVQANFTDDYYNNTLKTMMGFTWAVKYCSNARFYMFVDDDYYISTKNVLRFACNPLHYPHYLRMFKDRGLQELQEDVRFYGGYAFRSSPLRHWSSKWYVSLEEYPYDKWPPYVTAGAYILSKDALMDLYYASFYTKHFKFDDIYVALLAYKCKIEPFHCSEFYFDKLRYTPKAYEYVIASHGYGDPEELLTTWTKQRSLGHA